MAETAECRGCRQELRGKPYYMGGNAYHLKTGEHCPVNFYGGYVCSEGCDHRASRELESSMPGHDFDQKSIGCFAQESLRRNWPSD